MKIAVNHEVVQLLGEDGTCVNTYLDDDSGINVNENSDDFDGCMYSKLKELSTEQLGCTMPWLPDKVT